MSAFVAAVAEFVAGEGACGRQSRSSHIMRQIQNSIRNKFIHCGHNSSEAAPALIRRLSDFIAPQPRSEFARYGDAMLDQSAAHRRRLWLATSLMSALVLQGCAGGVSRRDTANYDGLLARGDYPQAATFAVYAGKIGPDGTSGNLLWSLYAGAAMVYVGDSAHTMPVLDHAEEMMKRRDIGQRGEKGQYRAKTYDDVMVNAYKAIAAMEAGQRDAARTELLRAARRPSAISERLRSSRCVRVVS